MQSGRRFPLFTDRSLREDALRLARKIGPWVAVRIYIVMIGILGWVCVALHVYVCAK